MAEYLIDLTPRMAYVDRHELLRSLLTEKEFIERRQEQLNKSTTVYVGNLSFYTTEDQIWEHFSRCGHIRDLVMGLSEVTRTPCGFCFVVFESQDGAMSAVIDLHGTLLDDRVITVSWDVGCDHTRRWGRGAHGGQVVDGVRQNLDSARGGLGVLRREELGVGAAVAEDQLVHYTWIPPRRVEKRGRS
ncbi:nuclear cap binding protein, putative [Trypanosoma equiperdum]|uniref:Nuclear cap-binding protein subunit 2 n=2 Tax=Trypanozoon TaxID=39700 RepID=Q585L4_TRYB2|nr:nuclear cap binding protein, putative [Trypanosoma brucei brucei TREU927]AAX79735.1 nuclear cap binding protein, putative [Trypanosoma brucei]AAZ11759.1 nuclear cap binding protein, putative [Trypanosoma brucei brucei TREU927]SCU69173.1 nuclear cap binding protein, putative [Trypanosoma equiperdum]